MLTKIYLLSYLILSHQCSSSISSDWSEICYTRCPFHPPYLWLVNYWPVQRPPSPSLQWGRYRGRIRRRSWRKGYLFYLSSTVWVCEFVVFETYLSPRQEGRMNENRDVTSFLLSRLNQALLSTFVAWEQGEGYFLDKGAWYIFQLDISECVWAQRKKLGNPGSSFRKILHEQLIIISVLFVSPLSNKFHRIKIIAIHWSAAKRRFIHRRNIPRDRDNNLNIKR